MESQVRLATVARGLQGDTTIVRAVIVDDDRPAREKIRSLLNAHPDVQIVAECADGREAASEISRLRPELVFLDIAMPGLDVFDMLRRLRNQPPPAVVFVTAHDEYAIDAFQVEAVDYLLKPFDRWRFDEALRRARRRIERDLEPQLPDRLLAALEQMTARPPKAPAWNRFVIKVRDRMTFISTADIDWIEAQGKYVRLHCGSATHLVREPIRTVEQRLDPREFARIHRRIIVNLRRVTEMYRSVDGHYTVALNSGQTLTVSRRYWSKIKHLGGVR